MRAFIISWTCWPLVERITLISIPCSSKAIIPSNSMKFALTWFLAIHHFSVYRLRHHQLNPISIRSFSYVFVCGSKLFWKLSSGGIRRVGFLVYPRARPIIRVSLARKSFKADIFPAAKVLLLIAVAS